MDAHLFSNLVSYSAQVAAIAGGGSIVLTAMRVHAPRVRYAWWRGLLVLCLVLPWVQARQPLPAQPIATASTFAFVEAVPVSAAAASADLTIDWVLVATVVLIAGATLRLLWIAASLVRLRRLRSAGAVALSAEDEELQRRLGTRAEIRCVPGLGQPVTFGVRRPVVLLPEALQTHAPGIRRAVLCHELIHVQRRDWVWVLVEELVRSVLWFHPGAWWIVSRVQLAREEAVDAQAVGLTGSRRSYVEALLAFADGAPLAAAPAFLRRRHLFRRILLISKETVMSPRRIAVSCLVLVCAAAAGSWFVVHAFPLSQEVARAEVVQETLAPLGGENYAVENTAPRLVYRVMPEYPSQLGGTDFGADVGVRMTVDTAGNVTNTRVEHFSTAGRPSSGGRDVGSQDTVAARESEAALVRATRQAVLQWRYEPPANGPLAMRAMFAFAPGGRVELVGHSAVGGWSREARPAAALGTPAPTATPSGAVSAPQPPVRRESLAPGTEEANAGPVRVRDIVFEGNASPPAAASPAPAGVASQSARPTAPIQGPAGQVTTTPPAPRPVPREPVRVGGNLQAPKKIKDVKPVYPAEAQAAGVQGIVIVEAVIDEKGKIRSARAIRSIPLLDEAALDAVKQWEFTPTLLNGVPTPIIMSVTVNFQLTARSSAQGSGAPPVNGRAPVRVGGNITAPTKTKDMRPVYPAIALAAKVTGIVILELTIDAEGKVASARIVRSVPLLDQAALDAVQQWEFTPTLLNGVPTPVVMTVTVPFTMTER